MIIFDANRIGKKIAAARKAKNMAQNDLADQLSVSYQAVSNWERGQSVPDIDKYADLSQILDLSLDDLLNTADAAHKVTIVQDDTAKVDADTLKDFAPVMKPAQVDEKADDVDLSPDYLKDIAPFLSDEALFKQLMKHRDAPSFLQQVVAVAPFLADDDLNKIVEKYVLPNFPGNSQLLAKLLPFMDERVANEVLEKYWADPNFDRKARRKFYPFVDSAALQALLVKHPDEVNAIVDAAPFLDDEAIAYYFKTWAADPDMAPSLSKLAPFAPSGAVADHVRHLIKTGADRNEWHAFLPFLDDDDLLSLGKSM
jgi:transcriptional regulator with XRE-family HTH domain